MRKRRERSEGGREEEVENRSQDSKWKMDRDMRAESD